MTRVSQSGFEGTLDMKRYSALATITLALHMSSSTAQEASPATSKPIVAPAAGSEQETSLAAGLNELNAMTFECPKAALNAAARAASQVPAKGTYQFSYFKIVNDAHHAAYEVRFKSNFEGEPDLKYCVAMYCQQGWDPKASQPEVTLMADEPRRKSRHGTGCGAHSGSGKH